MSVLERGRFDGVLIKEEIVLNALISFIPIIGPVIAAIIAALITFMVAVITKENKVSEFRLEWIETLRTEVSEMLAVFNVLENVFKPTVDSVGPEKDKRIDEFWKEYYQEYVKLDAAVNKVVLMLNPEEHKALIEKVRSIENSIGKGPSNSAQVSSMLVEDFAVLLKAEWKRVKAGENVFRYTKLGAAIIFFGGAVMFLVMLGVIFLRSL